VACQCQRPARGPAASGPDHRMIRLPVALQAPASQRLSLAACQCQSGGLTGSRARAGMLNLGAPHVRVQAAAQPKLPLHSIASGPCGPWPSSESGLWAGSRARARRLIIAPCNILITH
jgi:hypothetical protein